ncbi:TonB-dependent hemoglobin/transferrin/lactoferrin family receptor [Labrys okinawensis]|uniref:TonB-dependent hemoglobin/transferrin/lactoferrin family receptor n=1 Tax=Labrys okinawensis TaxID=346911 RepID=A0A2S9Q9L0_9HYPH|nr:TonB-dependent hemoglobin/transferrin/lactoferrin family receptor [Labrys okinawensis]PRH86039.1 TonB-dependent hemoglobin/transferrin/lactoferrin family receptor [Labrys okinawensis]
METRIIVAAGLLLAGCAMAARAQEAEPRQDHPAAPAPAAQAGTDEPVMLEPVTVVAERAKRQLLDVPATVTVISDKELKSHMVRDIDDLTRYEPGITVGRNSSSTDPFGGNGGFTIRGVGGNRIQMRVDGSRILDGNTDGTRDFVDLPFIKSVEIIRGPASALYGTDAVGGLVAFTTRDPADVIKEGRSWGLEASTNFDSYNKALVNTVLGAWRVSPNLEILLGYSVKKASEAKLSRARADGGRYGCPRWVEYGAIDCGSFNPLDELGQNFLAKIVWRPTESLELKLTGEIFDRNRDADILYNRGPVTVRTPANPNPPQLPFIHSYTADQKLTRYRIALDGLWKSDYAFADQIRWNITWSPQRREVTGREHRTLANGNQQYQDNVTEFGQRFLQAGLQIDSSFKLGRSDHKLVWGFDGEYGYTDYVRNRTTRVFTPGGVPVSNTTVVPYTWNFADSNTKRLDAFVQDEISLLDGKLLLTPALRYSWNQITPKPKSDYRPVPGYVLRQRDEAALTKKLGIIYKLDETYSVFGLYAEGFRMPNAEQLYTGSSSGQPDNNLVPAPNLKPERVRSFEAGLRGRYGWGYFSLSAFHADYTNFIQNFVEIPASSGNGLDYTWANRAKVRLSGIEGSAEVQWAEHWSSSLSLTYQYGDQKTTRDAPWTPFNGASPFTAVASLRWTRPEQGLEVEMIGTFASKVSRASAPDIFKPGGYAVFDLLGSWKPTENVTLRAGVFNIADTRYFRWPMPTTYSRTASSNVAFSNPLELQTAAGRTFKLGANITF